MSGAEGSAGATSSFPFFLFDAAVLTRDDGLPRMGTDRVEGAAGSSCAMLRSECTVSVMRGEGVAAVALVATSVAGVAARGVAVVAAGLGDAAGFGADMATISRGEAVNANSGSRCVHTLSVDDTTSVLW